MIPSTKTTATDMGHHKHSFVGFLLLLLWSCLNSIGLDLVEGGCWGIEREALLAFKEGLIDPSNRLSSWIGQDCCKWAGVGCDNHTGHVIILNLRNPYAESDNPLVLQKHSLGGTITPSLQYLKHLSYLDMSHNDFGGIQIPNFFGMLYNLEYLNLSFASFGGQIPPSLGNLSSLQYLDLAQFWGRDTHVKDLHWLAGLSSLRHLNLGGVNLSATEERWIQAINKIPSLLELYLPMCQLAHLPLTLPVLNLTSLLTVDMSANNFNSTLPNWLYNLTKLQHLDLHLNAFNDAGSVHKQLGNLCNLQILDLSYNNFHGEIKSLLADFPGCWNTSLMWLQLSSNKFVGSLPNSLVELKNLQYFDVSNNNLTGSFPNSLATLRHLQYLDLSSNSFSGSIPESIGNLSSLRMLDLSGNIMNGTIPESFGQLLELVEVRFNFPLATFYRFALDPTYKPWSGVPYIFRPYIGFEPHYTFNSWNGVFTEAHLINLTSLENIILTVASPSSLVFKASYDWVPPFMLKEIHIENCLISEFPAWLKSQSELTYVILRNAGISDTIPETWLSRTSTRLRLLDLSNNKIKGRLPRTMASQNLSFIDLSKNLFEGPVPFWSTDARTLYLDDNLLSGPIPENIGDLMPGLIELVISGNRLQGSIPSSLCKMKNLKILSLGSNRLFGELPDCWSQSQTLETLDAANNSIKGRIPRSICFLRGLQFLLLSKNNFEGKIPACLQNCSGLRSLDLAENRLSGKLPPAIGVNLNILRLGSNSLTGKIPPQLCVMKCVHIIDLSNNGFFGVIPKCVNNLTMLVFGNTCLPIYFNAINEFKEQATIMTKGTKLNYMAMTLQYVNNIDLSGNSITGRIPEEITEIAALHILNLSMNHLSGSIPDKIGNLRWLESLDLSRNELSGHIPQSFSSLTSLSYLNLSYNNLTGKIPSGNQLETLNDPSIYEGNPSLCGFPLPMCPGDSTSTGSTSAEGSSSHNKNHDDDDNKDNDKIWLAVSIITGFLVGFWGVCGGLALKKSWRYAFFGYVNQMNVKILLWIALKMARYKRRLEEPNN